MVKVLVTYYSKTGHTEELAKAVAEGVREAGGTAALKKVSEVDVAELPTYDGIIIGSPVYFGTMASEVKKLIDDSISVRRKLEGKVGAAFVTSRHRTGGKETTLLSILEAMLIHGMVVVGDPIEVGGHYGAAGTDEQAKKEALGLGKRVTEIAGKL
ncbi:MAG: NAD(P)H-dependent oxidoreductase [Euryarchaeota archaeon]|nr:NAD(P)H-dependent oxidoreductase [Euryarchaeota archaeon]